MTDQIFPVVLLLAIVIVFGSILLFITSLTGTKVKPTATKNMPYECGVPGIDTGNTMVPIRFYLTAISFILFDLEVVFLYPWLLIYKDNMKELGGYLLGSMGIFVAVLVFGLFYEWKAKALEWD